MSEVSLKEVKGYDFSVEVGKADLNLKILSNYNQKYSNIADKINFEDPNTLLQLHELLQLISEHQLNLLATVLSDYHQKGIPTNS